MLIEPLGAVVSVGVGVDVGVGVILDPVCTITNFGRCVLSVLSEE